MTGTTYTSSLSNDSTLDDELVYPLYHAISSTIQAVQYDSNPSCAV